MSNITCNSSPVSVPITSKNAVTGISTSLSDAELSTFVSVIPIIAVLVFPANVFNSSNFSRILYS